MGYIYSFSFVKDMNVACLDAPEPTIKLIWFAICFLSAYYRLHIYLVVAYSYSVIARIKDAGDKSPREQILL